MVTIESSALNTLREKIYAHRSELTSAFAQHDINGTGNTASLSRCRQGENRFHVCGEAEGTNPMEGDPTCCKAGGQQRLLFFLTTEGDIC